MIGWSHPSMKTRFISIHGIAAVTRAIFRFVMHVILNFVVRNPPVNAPIQAPNIYRNAATQGRHGYL